MAQATYLVFWGGVHTAVGCVHGDIANAQPGDVWVPFEPVNGDMVAQHYDYDANHNLVYSPPAPPVIPPQPNVMGFFGLVHADSTITDAEKGVLAALFGTLASLIQAGQPDAIKAVWQNAIAAYGPTGQFGTWLTASMQTVIQNYASQCNIALV